MIIKTVQGFLIIELLVAIVIMASMSLVFMGYYTKTLIIQNDIALYLQATTHIKNALEGVLVIKKMPKSNYHKEGQFTIQWRVLPKQIESLPILDSKLVVIEAVISWQSLMKKSKSITMVSAFVPEEYDEEKINRLL